MAWHIKWSQTALKDLYALEKQVIERIITKLEQAAEKPHHFFERLVGQEDYKLRVGDYRLVVLLLYDKQIIFIQKVKHRKNVYKE